MVFRAGDARGCPALYALPAVGAGAGAPIRIAPEHSLHQFAACWLFAVLLLFTTAATKLPSYWLPATPAAALLVAQATVGSTVDSSRWQRMAWGTCLALIAVLAAGFWLGSLWVPLIEDPEMPTLSVDLLASGPLKWAAVWFSAAAVLGACLLYTSPSPRD